MNTPDQSGENLPEFVLYAPIYDFVRNIPAGKVVTYGQVADCVEGVAFTARQVGMAMNVVPEGVPWQRVVGAGGTLPIHKRSPELAAAQRRLLEQEGVEFLPNTSAPRVDMLRFQWQAPLQGEQGSLFAEEGE